MDDPIANPYLPPNDLGEDDGRGALFGERNQCPVCGQRHRLLVVAFSFRYACSNCHTRLCVRPPKRIRAMSMGVAWATVGGTLAYTISVGFIRAGWFFLIFYAVLILNSFLPLLVFGELQRRAGWWKAIERSE